MTVAEAEELQIQWGQLGATPPCTHASHELGQTENGYLTGILHCVDCGKAFAMMSVVRRLI
jgi:hypothetical protein